MPHDDDAERALRQALRGRVEQRVQEQERTTRSVARVQQVPRREKSATAGARRRRGEAKGWQHQSGKLVCVRHATQGCQHEGNFLDKDKFVGLLGSRPILPLP